VACFVLQQRPAPFVNVIVQCSSGHQVARQTCGLALGRILETERGSAFDDSLAALLFRWGVVLPLLQDLAAASLNPIHLIGKGKPPLREQRKTFLQGWLDR
jgi:hypothetical protein